MRLEHTLPWLTPYPVVCGMLAVGACGYLAAVFFLCVETTGPLREEFRRRAVLGGTATAALAGLTLVLAKQEGAWFFERLMSQEAMPVVVAGLGAFAVSAWTVFGRRYRRARAAAVAEEVVLLLVGWAVAHYPYLMYPDVRLAEAAGPVTTIRFLVIATLGGLSLLVPSLVMLFRIFKSEEGMAHE